MELLLIVMIIAIAGIGAQWLAWRWQLPAIVLMLAAGIVIGPVAGIFDPREAFGEILSPVITLAVALILFEGGLSLDFARLRDAGQGVRRLVLFGGPLIWVFSALSAHYIGGLSWPSAWVFGGILVVTGPTVIIPLLRQAGLDRRAAAVLRWEAIVNDPIGALCAVLAFEVATVTLAHHSFSDAAGVLLAGVLVSIFVGLICARIIIEGFERGLVPEYLKVPALITIAIAAYVIPDFVLHESGLLSVTLMGILIANAHLPSLGELRRFKEHLTVILVSGVFIMLAAMLDFKALARLDAAAYAFVFAVIFLVRPVSVLIALARTNLSMKERLIIGWIGPRGVVAVAVAGLFGERLAHLGVADGAIFGPLAFVIVCATILLHGFSIGPLARSFGLISSREKGLLIVGTSPFALALSEILEAAQRPFLVVDRNWFALREFRQRGYLVFYGEILSETAEHNIDHNAYSDLLAISDNDDHNALICADFGPEFGRNHVFQLAMRRGTPQGRALPQTLGGRYLAGAPSFDDVADIMAKGGRVGATSISEKYGLEQYLADNPGAMPLMAIPEKGDIRLFRNGVEPLVYPGERLVALVPSAPVGAAQEREGEGEGS